MEAQQFPEEAYVTFAGAIDHQAVQRVFAGFPIAVNNNVKRIHLAIHSLGGYVSDGIAIHNYLRGLPIEIVTYNMGSVASIAVLFFLAGKVRKATRNATFMIHKTTFSFTAPMTAFDMRHRAETAELDDRNTDAIYRAFITMPEDRWTMRERADLTISAEDAKTYGIIHAIGDFAPPPGNKVYNI